jgi:hypothetical protein
MTIVKGLRHFSVSSRSLEIAQYGSSFDPPVADGNKSYLVLQTLAALGCSYEGSSPSYIALNIPLGVQLDLVREYLIEQEAQWEYADPSYTELFPDDA